MNIFSGITAPDRKMFFTALMSWLDFLAILPYFVLLFTKVSDSYLFVTVSSLSLNFVYNFNKILFFIIDPNTKFCPFQESNNTIEILRVLRLARVLRVFKLVRRSKKLLLIGKIAIYISSKINLISLFGRILLQRALISTLASLTNSFIIILPYRTKFGRAI